MCAWTREQEERSRWRRRLARGLLLGGAAVGLPAAINALWRKRASQIQLPAWGDVQTLEDELGEIAFRHVGEGSTVVLLHAFGPGHDGTEWRAVAEALAADHRVLVPDLPGWGRSVRLAGGYGPELYTGFLERFLDREASGGATVVAAGQSAAYALSLAAGSSERVHALALVSPLGLDAGRDGPDRRGRGLFRLLGLPVLGTSALNVMTTRKGSPPTCGGRSSRIPTRSARSSSIGISGAPIGAATRRPWRLTWLASSISRSESSSRASSNPSGSAGGVIAVGPPWKPPTSGCASSRRPTSRSSTTAAACPIWRPRSPSVPA